MSLTQNKPWMCHPAYQVYLRVRRTDDTIYDMPCLVIIPPKLLFSKCRINVENIDSHDTVTVRCDDMLRESDYILQANSPFYTVLFQ